MTGHVAIAYATVDVIDAVDAEAENEAEAEAEVDTEMEVEAAGGAGEPAEGWVGLD